MVVTCPAAKKFQSQSGSSKGRWYNNHKSQKKVINSRYGKEVNEKVEM